MTKSAGFGQVLRYFRENRGLVQEQLAERIGVNRSQIPKWERERQGMRLESLVEVLDALDAGMEEFGRCFDRLRRGEPLGNEASEEAASSEAARAARDETPPVSGRKGRAAIFLWEEATAEEIVGPHVPDDPEEIATVLSDLRIALDQLRPPEERDKLGSKREPPPQAPDEEDS